MNKSFSGALCVGVLLPIAIVLIAPPPANATPFYRTSQFLNGHSQGLTGILLDPFAFDLTRDGSTASSSLAGAETITGLDAAGNAASMTLSFDGESRVSSGGTIQSRASASLANGFLNIAQNTPIRDANGNINPNGVPEYFSFTSDAEYTDNLSINGASGLDHIILTLHLDGVMSGDLATRGGVQLLQNGNLFSASDFNQPQVDEIISSNSISVINGVADVSLKLITSAQFNIFRADIYDMPGSDLLSASSNFFNTLTIDSIAGFDVNGNPVDVSGATDSTGLQFKTVRIGSDTTPITEPSIFMLMGLGLFGLIGFGRHGKRLYS